MWSTYDWINFWIGVLCFIASVFGIANEWSYSHALCTMSVFLILLVFMFGGKND